MRPYQALCLIGAVPILLIGSAIAGPASRQSVTKLTEAADAIVTGSVEAMSSNGIVTASVGVERVLKGAVIQGSTVSLLWNSPPSGLPYGPGRITRGHGIFFMREGATGLLTLLPATGGDVSWEETYIPTAAAVPPDIASLAASSLPPNPSVLDKVLVEIVSAREAGGSVPVDLIETFRESHSQVLAAAFGRFRSRQDPSLASLGLWGLIATGDASTILAVRQNYVSLSSRPFWGSMIEEIKRYYLNTDLGAIRVLGETATDSGVGIDLRIATGAALGRMHTQQTLPYLAKLLDDENLTLKTIGVGGLSSFANNVLANSHQMAPGDWKYRTEDTVAHSAFDENLVRSRESYYADFWRNWWQLNQSILAR